MAKANDLFSDPSQVKYLSADVTFHNRSPFLVGEPVNIDSLAGTTLYGANHPGDASTTKYAAFKQTISGNKAFLLPTAVNTPANTTGGALSAANQLRCIVMVEEVPTLRTRGDATAAAGGSIVGAGGGTAAGDATLQVKGTTAANLLAGSVLLSLASTGANTKTIIAGDTFTIAGSTQVYTFTGEGTLTLNGTTEINVGITPPLQAAVTAAAVVTIVAATGKNILVGTAPAVGATVEVCVMDAADIITETGGAMTAGRLYVTDQKSFYHTAGAVNLSKLMSH